MALPLLLWDRVSLVLPLFLYLLLALLADIGIGSLGYKRLYLLRLLDLDLDLW
jgi:hypothetical protein